MLNFAAESLFEWYEYIIAFGLVLLKINFIKRE